MKTKVLGFFKNPVWGLFIVLYIVAVIFRSTAGIANIAIYLGMDAALIGLIYFIYYLTRKREPITIQYKEPGIELAIGLMLVEVVRLMLPSLSHLEWWDLGSILEKNITHVVLIVALCSIRHTPLFNWKVTSKNFWRDTGLGLFVLLMMAIPSAYYSGTMENILNGSLKINWLPGLLGISFIHMLFYSGLHEEVLFRGFIQSRLGGAFKNEWQGLVISSLYFGLLHTAGNQLWGYDEGIMGGFTESMFVQTFHGLIFGMLWMRTKSVIPGIIVHSGLNAVTNLTAVAENLNLL